MKFASTLSLYRDLLRLISRELPAKSRPYYRSYLKNQTRGNSDEDDIKRIEVMHQLARDNARWIVKKYEK